MTVERIPLMLQPTKVRRSRLRVARLTQVWSVARRTERETMRLLSRYATADPKDHPTRPARLSHRSQITSSVRLFVPAHQVEAAVRINVRY